jgi:uncharacterized protein YbcI
MTDTGTHGVLSSVSAAVARVFSERWGRGPQKTRAYWAGEDVLVVVLENGHTVAEQTLLEAGHDREVIGGRRLLQELLEPQLRSAVEDVTGRTVRQFLSATALHPDVSVEIFLFGDMEADRRNRPITEVLDENVALRAESSQVRSRSRQLREDRRRWPEA